MQHKLRTMLIPASVLVIGTSMSAPVYGQAVAYPPPFISGMASGAQFGAQVSASYPTIRCFGGRFLECGAHFSSRPIVAGALIGGLIGALSTPVYLEAPLQAGSELLAPGLQEPVRYPWPVTSVADRWQQFADPENESRTTHRKPDPRFVERWQKFFEPVQ